MKNKLLNVIILIGLTSNTAQAATAPYGDTRRVKPIGGCSIGRCCLITSTLGVTLSLASTAFLLRFIQDNPGQSIAWIRDAVRNHTNEELETSIATLHIGDSIAPEERDYAIEILRTGYKSLFNAFAGLPTSDQRPADALVRIIETECPKHVQKAIIDRLTWGGGTKAPRRKEKFGGKVAAHRTFKK